MLKKRQLIISFIMMLTLFSAGCAGASDYEIDLPGNYSVIRSSAHDVKISPKIGENGWGPEVVPAEVVEVGWNEKYIIAKQQQGAKNENFWIIEIETENVIGPLNNENFTNKQAEYGIEDISLKKVQELEKAY
ncbi:DUF3997 domain-containing protein [Bacillus mesophilum]|uniref:DUF3997 domain-containing protein n=1 Tax=Bacillus mesophilum TaxID=1071718 RepID=A0A7V7RLQ7_9BACI|nr:DUF3997 domain-containing protein [Bacillus mesophilum]KAB2332783.1 DUF3997 domain-containing protein [Bacillus mesophilum]